MRHISPKIYTSNLSKCNWRFGLLAIRIFFCEIFRAINCCTLHKYIFNGMGAMFFLFYLILTRHTINSIYLINLKIHKSSTIIVRLLKNYTNLGRKFPVYIKYILNKWFRYFKKNINGRLTESIPHKTLKLPLGYLGDHNWPRTAKWLFHVIPWIMWHYSFKKINIWLTCQNAIRGANTNTYIRNQTVYNLDHIISLKQDSMIVI